MDAGKRTGFNVVWPVEPKHVKTCGTTKLENTNFKAVNATAP